MAVRVLSVLLGGARSKSEVARNLGRKKPTRYLHDLMKQLIEKNLLELTLPDKPNSRLQKYRLTAKGRATVEKQEKDPL